MPTAEHYGGRLRPGAYNRFRPHPGPERRKANERTTWRHCTVDCTRNLGWARETEQEGGCFLVRDGHGRGGFWITHLWSTSD